MLQTPTPSSESLISGYKFTARTFTEGHTLLINTEVIDINHDINVAPQPYFCPGINFDDISCYVAHSGEHSHNNKDTKLTA